MTVLQTHYQRVSIIVHGHGFVGLQCESQHPHAIVLKFKLVVIGIDLESISTLQYFGRNDLRGKVRWFSELREYTRTKKTEQDKTDSISPWHILIIFPAKRRAY